MRKCILKLAVVVVFFTLLFSANAFAGENTFDDYKITPVEKQELDAGADCAWTLSYSENESPIVITLQKTKRCKNYIVRSKYFEVVYVCSGKGFGARAARMSESTVPDELNRQVINLTELEKQGVISSENVTEEDALKLIAAYLPDLINAKYQHILS